MLGFIKKDLFIVKSNLKLLLIIFVIYGVMAYQGEMDLSFMAPFMSVMVMISTFSYDAFNKWDAYAITLPEGRKNSVRGKYAATLLIIVASAIVTSILSFLVSYSRTQTVDFEYILMTMFGCTFATIIIAAIMYPANYKFGVEKARIGVFIIIFGIAIIAGIINKFVDFSKVIGALNDIGNYWFIILPLIMILILYISYKISEHIYLKKEF